MGVDRGGLHERRSVLGSRRRLERAQFALFRARLPLLLQRRSRGPSQCRIPRRDRRKFLRRARLAATPSRSHADGLASFAVRRAAFNRHAQPPVTSEAGVSAGRLPLPALPALGSTEPPAPPVPVTGSTPVVVAPPSSVDGAGNAEPLGVPSPVGPS